MVDPQSHPSVLHLLTFMFVFVECGGWSSESPLSSTPIYDLFCFVECEHLIRRMLVVEPKRRYSLSQIKAHKWMQRDGGPPTQRPPSPEVSTAQPAQPRPGQRWVPPSQRPPRTEVSTAQSETVQPAGEYDPNTHAPSRIPSPPPPPPSPEVSKAYATPAQPGGEYRPPSACPARRWVPPKHPPVQSKTAQPRGEYCLPSPEMTTAQTPSRPVKDCPAQRWLPPKHPPTQSKTVQPEVSNTQTPCPVTARPAQRWVLPKHPPAQSGGEYHLPSPEVSTAQTPTRPPAHPAPAQPQR